MSWLCPVCRLPIAHAPSDDKPILGGLYHCQACRLELTIDPDTNELVGAPVARQKLDRRRNGPEGRGQTRRDRRQT